MSPPVSIVVAIFNATDYLARCLGSIASQSFADFEAILVDDGSTDGSAQAAEAFCRQDPRFRLLRHPANRGSAAARNTGLRAARGVYVAQVDSDDAITPDMLATLYDAAREGDFDMVACGYRELDPDGTVRRSVVPEPRTIRFDGPPRDIFALTDPSTCDKLWRRSAFAEPGIWFAEGRRYDDLGWTYRVLMQCRRIRILDRALYDYTLRPGSETHSFSWNSLIEHVAAFELLHRAMTDAGIVEHNIASFRARVRATFGYHATKVCALAPPSEERMRYLLGVLAISEAYTRDDAGAFGPDDTDAIITAIEDAGASGRDPTIVAQRERIRALMAEIKALKGEAATLRALANDLARTLRGPIFLLRPLAALCTGLARLGLAGFEPNAARLRGLRARLAGLNRAG
ncbi:MAG TPA: glycosyltransferase [Roseomonas sp.]|nr:glycosyltransferase [Roseomonas sp.]